MGAEKTRNQKNLLFSLPSFPTLSFLFPRSVIISWMEDEINEATRHANDILVLIDAAVALLEGRAA